MRDERGDEGVEPGDGEALLAPHARPHHHEGLAVPVGPAGQVLGRSVVAQVHRQEVALVATVSPDQAVVLDQLGQRVVERLRQVGGYVVGLDVEREPAARGVLGHPLSLERVGRARPLENEQCRERTGCRTGGAGELPVDMRAAHVAHPNREELDARSPALARREDRVERDGIEAAQLSRPKRIEVRRAAVGRPDLSRSDCRAEQHPADLGLTRAVKAGRTGRRPHFDEQHAWLIERCHDGGMTRRQVQGARADQRETVALDRVRVCPRGSLARRDADVPPHALAQVVHAVRMVGREGQLLRDDQDGRQHTHLTEGTARGRSRPPSCGNPPRWGAGDRPCPRAAGDATAAPDRAARRRSR